jgi:hypothetical protein
VKQTRPQNTVAKTLPHQAMGFVMRRELAIFGLFTSLFTGLFLLLSFSSKGLLLLSP